ncbi:Putative Zn-dependent hydrolase of beta-lactamase fold protein OS=Clostridium sp. BNL1100 GN=Clo1100_3002 PE=4 SV=1: Lactamase_B_3 [Gemmata massiliana]|uniref:Metallo-beta-lactamase domain-containing protein n=1 Tax=Gemmata massiliana TaxID=1210884 RepID=A0A6P2DKS2_9BACT|nr:MBL fold metallo-hydrolase [Gemmata massiliana]VTS02903.1 Putative Zn-dependent hydrolase of beta-lactamase fold protein OS=Clostridium sp. BNL1100 GN=Clo1100_3002 PE=4 SV=1: Lactamase_B_3 [Gemmata massiliana]
MSRLFVAIGCFALLFSSLVVVPAPVAMGQEKEQAIKIRWFGQSFFQIESAEGRKIAIDPHAIPAFGRQSTTAEFILISHSHDDHALIDMVEKEKKEDQFKEGDILRGVVEPKPGKQEWKTIDEKRGSIRVRTVATYHDTMNGMQRGKNSIWVIEMNGLVICHLGDLGHELSPEQVKAIGKVDVLMVPVGGIYTINGEQAQNVMKQLKPRLYTLPMHYGIVGYDELAGPEEFLDGIKKEDIKKFPETNEIVIPVNLKLDSPQIAILNWRKEEPKKEEPKKPDPKKPDPKKK